MLKAAVWPLLFVTVREYALAPKPAGNCATAFWVVKEASASCVCAKTTVGASPDGLKLLPAMVSWFF
jgi:hypothetical protein